MTIFIKAMDMLPREPHEGKEAVNSGKADRLLVRSDTMNRNERGEKESQETSGRRKRTCQGAYGRAP